MADLERISKEQPGSEGFDKEIITFTKKHVMIRSMK